MAASEDPDSEWETQADIDACLQEIGVTGDQINRWRREGLLPPVVQSPRAYRGSTVHYPKGTCAQIRAAQALFREKNRRVYVGLRLWRMGCTVSEDYWRPRLRRFSLWADWVLPFINRLASHFDRNWQGETLQERAARHPATNIILSRIKRRLETEELASFYRVLIEIGTGEFMNFEYRAKDETRSPGEGATIKAFDFDKAESHKILGQKFNFIDVLPSALENTAIAFSMGHFAQAAEAPTEEIAKARDDARNSLQIGLSLYDAFEWIYGEGAFGLRFIAWLARKAPDAVIDGWLLGIMRLRAVPDAILPSEQIAEMARQTQIICKASKHLEWLWQHDPRYKQVLDPKRIRAAFVDQISLKRWQKQVRDASISSLDAPMGSQGP